jgi:anthranilate phosphoribosyltransferase
VLQRLGSEHVLIVHGSDGLDEITITGATRVGELKNGQVNVYTVRPEDFGLNTSSIEAIQVTDSEHAKTMLLSVLENTAGTARDIVLMNAGAAIYAAGVTDTLAQGIQSALRAIESGAALKKLHDLVEFTHRNSV